MPGPEAYLRDVEFIGIQTRRGTSKRIHAKWSQKRSAFCGWRIALNDGDVMRKFTFNVFVARGCRQCYHSHEGRILGYAYSKKSVFEKRNDVQS